MSVVTPLTLGQRLVRERLRLNFSQEECRENHNFANFDT